MGMKKILLISLLTVIGIGVYAQGSIRSLYLAKNFGAMPKIDESINGVWNNGSDIYADSVYITQAGVPNNKDLLFPDLEQKMKILWHKDSVFFLMRRIDSKLVTGKTKGGGEDAELAPGLQNRDATAVYFYLATDSAHIKGQADEGAIAWMRFVWQSEDFEAKLPDGTTVNTPEQFNATILQWSDTTFSADMQDTTVFYYAKFGVDLIKLKPGLVSLDTKVLAFEVELNENDKEVGNAPFSMQTRAFFGGTYPASAIESIKYWPWIKFFTAPQVVSTHENNLANLTLYPNPSDDFVIISKEHAERVDYSLIDLMGKLVGQGEFEGTHHKIDLSALNKGIYFLKIRTVKGASTVKRMVVR